MISSRRSAKVVIIALLATIAVAALIAATFPIGIFKGWLERKLSDDLERAVTISAMERESAFSFSPVIRLKGVHVPQAKWAGYGALASIGLLRVRIDLWPALFGQFKPQLVSAHNVELNLVRDASQRVNWRSTEPSRQNRHEAFSLEGIESATAKVQYRDDFQKRSANVDVIVGPKTGFVVRGSGSVDGNPVTIAAHGPVGEPGKRWPFETNIGGAALTMQIKGTMAAPMRLDDMAFRIKARASDLKLIDRVIEAGLFGTQPVDLAANVLRKGDRWTINDLAGTIGSSSLTGELIVDKVDDRTKLDGKVRFASLDFEDLATDASNAAALALEQAQGRKLVPNTRINIRKIKNTDGRIAFRIDRIVSRRPSAMRSAEGTLTINNRLLMAKPFVLHLSRGLLGGEITVDQRKGQPQPTVTLALDLKATTIDALAGVEGDVDAAVDGRVRLTGVGDTFREAVGRSSGTIGVVAHNGSLPAKLASLLGFDVGKASLGAGETRAALRCAVMRLNVRGGVGIAGPALVDTSASQTQGTGTVSFPDERLALTLTGAPKRDAVLRVPGHVSVLGTVRNPSIVVPKEVKSLGNILKAVGRSISGNQGPTAVDADCGKLRSQAMGMR